MLAVIRIVLFASYFSAVNVLLVLMCLVRPFHRDNVHISARMYAVGSRLLGVRIKTRVDDSVKQGGPYVYIGNHQNTFDIFTVCGATQPGTVTIGKKSLVWIPIFGLTYWLSGNILIDRANGKEARNTLKKAAQAIKERAISVWIFPEGTRSNGQGLLPFKSGAFLLAKMTKLPVVMISASNLHGKIRWNRWDNGTILIDISAPVVMDRTHDLKGWANYFHQEMRQRIDKLDAEVEQIDGKNVGKD